MPRNAAENAGASLESACRVPRRKLSRGVRPTATRAPGRPCRPNFWTGGAATIGCIDIYLEVGNKRTFACALEWPGWCRAGRDEQQAIQTLFEYAPRYARVVQGLGFEAPTAIEQFRVRERLQGDASTEMGSLTGNAPAYDSQPLDAADHQRLIQFLEACWRELDRVVAAARGKELRKGARGGGRSLEAIVEHVLGGEGAYLSRLAYRRSKEAETDAGLSRKAMLEALAAAVRGEVPETGPRGGKRWSGRYFVRREAWHVLDHAWEIEDRTQ